jgi:phage terminase large subunit-like protein
VAAKRPKAGPKTSKRWIQNASDERAIREGCWFDEAAAEEVWDFFENYLIFSHEGTGVPVRLLPWQQDEFLGPLFGWKWPDGLRRFKSGFLEVAKKNGKSTLCSGVALYLLTLDGEPAPEIGLFAVDKEQTGEVFTEAANMVEASEELTKQLGLNVHRSAMRITYEAGRGMIRCGSSIAGSKEGRNLHAAILDEIHAWVRRDLWNALRHADAARIQPILPLVITTAGSNRESLGYEQHEYARKVIECKDVVNLRHFARIYAASDKDDWTKRSTWLKANPSLDQGWLRTEEMQQKCLEAQQLGKVEENTFRRYRCNQWVKSEERCIDMAVWDDEGNAAPFDPRMLYGRLCYSGLDIGWQHDLTSYVLLFPDDDGGCWLVPHIWLPEASAAEQERAHGTPYTDWKANGLIDFTPGEVIDHAVVENRIVGAQKIYQHRTLRFDPRDCHELAIRLRDTHGIEVVEHPQCFAQYNEAFRVTSELITARKFRHGGHRVMRWCADNLMIKRGNQGDVMPAKPEHGSPKKIDVMAAAIMAVAAWIRDDSGSVYDTRGVRLL